ARAWEFSNYRPAAADLLTEADLSDEEAVAELTRLLKQAIRRRMVSDVPFGVLLSGGVDSSLIVALMSEMMDRPVTTFTIGYEGKEDYNEFRFARRISERFGTDHHEVRITRKQMQDFLPLLVQVQDEPIADNVCIPLYFLAGLVRARQTTVVQVGEGADENFLGYWWCDHYRQKEEQVYGPARAGARPSWSWRQMFGRPGTTAAISAEDRAIRQRAQAGQELFWGGATCWWGEMRDQLTPDIAPFRQSIECPVEGLLPDSHRRLDSHSVVAHYLAGLDGKLCRPEVLQKIPHMELSLRLPEHLLMRVDKLTMAHSIEARVPFLDHDVVEFARRLSPSFKLRGGVGKYVLKKAAEPYLEHDQVYRKKQGFGAPMEEWFQEGDFGRMCLAAFERSALAREGFLNRAYFKELLNKQIQGGGGYSFHLWTVMNAVLWHASWIEGRRECLAA
ncbi:MAG TPA: asparagine synthase C-terminal domain-containing protein, partial [Gemmataceae bacterium]|nr:asparagine synthase C-terminal domain-containing protein [Gemmataceae bacterium]